MHVWSMQRSTKGQGDRRAYLTLNINNTSVLARRRAHDRTNINNLVSRSSPRLDTTCLIINLSSRVSSPSMALQEDRIIR